MKCCVEHYGFYPDDCENCPMDKVRCPGSPTEVHEFEDYGLTSGPSCQHCGLLEREVEAPR